MKKKRRMSWRQLYNSSTATEQREMITIMFAALENRQAMQLRLIEIQHARHLAEKRKHNVLQILLLQLFLFALLTVGITSCLIVLHAPPSVAAPIMAFDLLMFTIVILIRPNRNSLSIPLRLPREKKPPFEI